MKRTKINYLLALLLIASFTFFSCKKEDEEPETGISGKIPGLSASLSSDNGRTIRLTFNDEAGEYITSSFNAYNVYHSEDGGEFERIKNGLVDTFYVDNRTKHGKTYQYFVHYENMYSDTIEISTAHPAMPWVRARAHVSGEGASATISHIKLSFFVGESRARDIVQKFEYFRDDVKIGEYQIPSVVNGNHFDYDDQSISFNFDQEYVYKVVAHTIDGEAIESYNASVTANVPDEIDRPAPQIVGTTSDATNKQISFYVKDVSGVATFIEYYCEIEDGDLVYYWDGVPATSNLTTDAEGNYKITLNTDEVPGGFKSLRSKARVTISGKSSEWSAWNISTVFIGSAK